MRRKKVQMLVAINHEGAWVCVGLSALPGGKLGKRDTQDLAAKKLKRLCGPGVEPFMFHWTEATVDVPVRYKNEAVPAAVSKSELRGAIWEFHRLRKESKRLAPVVEKLQRLDDEIYAREKKVLALRREEIRIGVASGTIKQFCKRCGWSENKHKLDPDKDLRCGDGGKFERPPPPESMVYT